MGNHFQSTFFSKNYVSYNIGQIFVAALVVENASVAYYLPVLLAAGVVTGVLIGLLSKEMLGRIDRKKY